MADAPTPEAAAAALAELTRRREQVLAAHGNGPPTWELPLTMALTFAEWATRDLAGTPRHRSARTALRAANAAVALVRPGEGSTRVPADFLWLSHALPPVDPPPADDDGVDGTDGDARDWSSVGQAGCSGMLVLMVVAATVPSQLAKRLRRKGVRHPNTITGVVAALTIPPAARLLQRRIDAGVVRDRLLPDIASADSFPPDSRQPEPAFEPRFDDPALLSLLALLAPAGDVSDSFLRATAGLDDATLARLLSPLATAGFVERCSPRWTRRERTTGLTPRGRAAVAAHAAALRAAAA